jgi:hypothetical protein
VHKPKILRTTIFRLAVVYVAFFAVSVGALGLVAFYTTSFMLNYRLDAKVGKGVARLEKDYQYGCLPRNIAKFNMREKNRHVSALFYLVLGTNG